MSPVYALPGGDDQREPWVSAQSLADYLDVSVFTVRRLAKQGMPFRKVGSQLRFRKSEADCWIDDHQEET